MSELRSSRRNDFLSITVDNMFALVRRIRLDMLDDIESGDRRFVAQCENSMRDASAVDDHLDVTSHDLRAFFNGEKSILIRLILSTSAQNRPWLR